MVDSTLNIPTEMAIEDDLTKYPFAIVADEAFPLSDNLLRSQYNVDIDCAQDVIKACCVFHNLVILRDGHQKNSIKHTKRKIKWNKFSGLFYEQEENERPNLKKLNEEGNDGDN
nr:unnamed protein product [Callosobruchus analis]